MREDVVRELLPHREPFLFLRSAKVVSTTTGCGIAVWPAGHPIFAGHFPDLPIVPGVCQVEAAAQLAAVISAYNKPSGASDYVGVLGGIRKVLLHAPLFPDEALELKAELRNGIGAMGLCSGEGYRLGKRIITFELTLAVVPRAELEAAFARNREGRS